MRAATAKKPVIPTRQVDMQLPPKLMFLMDLHPYKVAYGGRFGLKCLALGTKVIMADGTLRAVEDVRIGDQVMGPDSRPRNVLKTGTGISGTYRIKQAFAMDYVVSAGHVLSLRKSNSAKIDKRIMHTGNPRSPNGRYAGWGDVVSITVEEYMAQSARWKTHFRGYRAGCLAFPESPVLVDPYLLGAWLGDGASRDLAFTTADPELIEACRDIAKSYGGDVTVKPSRSKAKTVRIPIKEGRKNPIWQGFRAYGLPNNKHIPQTYVANSESIRLHLLAGLLDTDGTRHHDGYVIYQTRESLARDIKRLADSLGFRTSILWQETLCSNNGVRGEAWRVSIAGDAWRIPCRIARKKIKQAECADQQEFLLSGITVEEAGLGAWAGFIIDGDHRFLLEDGTVTHNTRSFAIALLNLGANQKLRILCCREVMTSIKESVHEELKSLIEAHGLGSFYKVLDNEIRGRNGTQFIFAGLHGISAIGIKSYGNLDIVWVDEAQAVVKRSWDVLIPTVRAENSEIWVSFNPDMDSDDCWKRWVEHPPPGSIVVKMGWQDADELGWFPANENNKRLHCQRYEPDDYDNIWEGAPRTVVAGAIYTREILAMIQDQRIRPTPYDPRLPVHRIWDLGWNDAMSIIMVQKPTPTIVAVINYLEDSFKGYDEYIEDMKDLRYRWGVDWMPHDAEHHDPKSKTSAKKILQGFGCTVKIMPRTDPEARIKAARMMFPRVYIDDTERPRDSGFLGGHRLIDCLKRYKRTIPKSTLEPAAPVHDAVSHAADAFGGLAEIVDQIRNEFERKAPPSVPRFKSTVRGAGMLG